MGLVIAILVGCYVISCLVGRFIIVRVIASKDDNRGKPVQLALLRALFYTPTLAMGGHGVAILPAIVAMQLTEPKYYLTMLVAPALVFIVSLLVSSRKPKVDEPDAP